MTVSELAKTESFETVCMPQGTREITGGYCGDLLSWVMGRAKADCAWITIMSNANIVAVASLADVACIILCEGVKLDEGVEKMAAERNVNILSSSLDSYKTAALLIRALS